MLTTKKIKIVLLVSLFFFIAIPLMIGSYATPVAAKTIKLKFSYWMPTKHTLHRVFVKYAKEVEELTNGQVKITLYPGGALGGPREQWDMAVGGIAARFQVAKGLMLIALVVLVELLSLRFALPRIILQRPLVSGFAAATIIWVILLFGTFSNNAFIYFQF